MTERHVRPTLGRRGAIRPPGPGLLASGIVIIAGYHLVSGVGLWHVWLLVVPLAYPLAACAVLVLVARLLPGLSGRLAYPLFFAITCSSLFGLTQPLTGSHAESTTVALFGLSFYSAFLAYRCARRDIAWRDVWVAAHPLLLFTGPIATTFQYRPNTTVRRRCTKYLPFLIVGLFFLKIVATPLTAFLPLVAATHPMLVLFHGFVFELFVYFNFAGWSLIVYAVFGLVGARVPLNFRQPFSSRNMVEFWRGWHVTLSAVLKELFYRPVRRRAGATLAILCVFLSSALWHGVTANFIVWGTFHAACFLVTLRLLNAGRTAIATWLMCLAVVMGRVLFADSNVDRLLLKFSFDVHSAPFAIPGIPTNAYLSLGLACVLVGAEFAWAKQRHFRQRSYKYLRLPGMQLLLVALMVLLIMTSGSPDYAVYGQR